VSQRGAFHEAQRLDGRLRRLDARRARQIEAVESAYQADLMLMLQSVQPWLRAMVRKAIAEDPSAPPRLVAELAKAVEQLDPHERDSEPTLAIELQPKSPPYPTMPRLPSRLLRPAPDDQPLAGVDDDANAEWGIETKAPPLSQAELEALDLLEAGPEPETATVMRYPEPGEAATMLPTGEIVAAASLP
jgi:hypothetical protein